MLTVLHTTVFLILIVSVTVRYDETVIVVGLEV